MQKSSQNRRKIKKILKIAGKCLKPETLFIFLKNLANEKACNLKKCCGKITFANQRKIEQLPKIP